MFNKLLLATGVTFVLVGCAEPIPVDKWKEEDMSLRDIKGLEDCQFIKLRTHTNTNTLKVIRCPQSSTATNYNQAQGKSSIPITNVVIDDSNKTKELLRQIDDLNTIIKKQQQSLNDAAKILNERK